MFLLALDPSTKTGWAYGEEWRGIPKMEVGTFVLGEGTHVERFNALGRALRLFMSRHRVDLVGTEIPQMGVRVDTTMEPDGVGGMAANVKVMGSVQTQTLLWGLRAAIEQVSVWTDVPVVDFGVRTWRKAIFGNGNIAGVEAKRRSKVELKRYGVAVKNQDEAEAGMLLVHMNNHLPRIRLELKLRKVA